MPPQTSLKYRRASKKQPDARNPQSMYSIILFHNHTLLLSLRTNFYFTRNLFKCGHGRVLCSWVHGRVSCLLRCVPLGLLPGLLHTRLHPPLVLAPVLLEQLRRHRVRRRVRVGVTQLNRNSNVKSKSILGTFSEYRDNFLFSVYYDQKCNMVLTSDCMLVRIAATS